MRATEKETMPGLAVFSEEAIPLPYVGGEKTAPEGEQWPVVYDDSVDVYVEQGAIGLPGAALRFSPAGPCEFVVLGFDTNGLRRLAKFLNETADDLDELVERHNEAS